MKRIIFDPCSESVKTMATANSTKCWMLQIHILHKPGFCRNICKFNSAHALPGEEKTLVFP